MTTLAHNRLGGVGGWGGGGVGGGGEKGSSLEVAGCVQHNYVFVNDRPSVRAALPLRAVVVHWLYVLAAQAVARRWCKWWRAGVACAAIGGRVAWPYGGFTGSQHGVVRASTQLSKRMPPLARSRRRLQRRVRGIIRSCGAHAICTHVCISTCSVG
jgi:hypothetical protein